MICANLYKFFSYLLSCLAIIFLVTLPLAYSETSIAGEATREDYLILDGNLINKKKKPNISENISSIAIKDNILVVGADEGADLLVFKKKDTLKYTETEQICIPLKGKKCGAEHKGEEVDIEGIAWGSKYLYVIGSHSKARKKVKSDNSIDQNKKRLETIKIEPSREQVFRLQLNGEGNVFGGSKTRKISLRKLFTNHPVLSFFQSIPSKENGIDIEGLAVKEIDGKDRLYLGFRGPVLRGNHAMIMVLEFEGGEFKENKLRGNPKVHYVNLGGLGIRGMTEVGSGGFLILAGPVGDAQTVDNKSRYKVFFWNGEEDDVSGVARKPLCNIPASEEAKAEGIELLNKDRSVAEYYRFVIVFDGVDKGNATVFNCKA